MLETLSSLNNNTHLFISRLSVLLYQVVQGVYLTQALPSCFCWSDVPVHWTYHWISCQNVIFVTARRCCSFLKVVPLQMCIKCNTADGEMNNQHLTSTVDASCCTSESSLSDVIWFQCKHTIRGIPCKASLEGWSGMRMLLRREGQPCLVNAHPNGPAFSTCPPFPVQCSFRLNGNGCAMDFSSFNYLTRRAFYLQENKKCGDSVRVHCLVGLLDWSCSRIFVGSNSQSFAVCGS